MSSSFKSARSTPFLFDDIKEGLNGFARIIEYANHSVPEYINANDPYSGHGVISYDSKHMEIISVSEGEIEKGLMNGYNRRINFNGGAQVGFFKEEIPWGKYTEYAPDGSFEKPEGIYEGYANDGLRCKTKIQIANYYSKIARDIAKNKKEQGPIFYDEDYV